VLHPALLLSGPDEVPVAVPGNILRIEK
jgi:hypothetical protein